MDRYVDIADYDASASCDDEHKPNKKSFVKYKFDDQIHDSVIRDKWILLSKEHHPDNLISKGMPQEFIDQATKELSAINIAYDKIKKFRGIS